MMSTLQNKGSQRNVNVPPGPSHGGPVAGPGLEPQGVTGPLKKEEKERPSLSPYEGNDLLQDQEQINKDILVSKQLYDKLVPPGTIRRASKCLKFIREAPIARAGRIKRSSRPLPSRWT
jgi:hypothetical protein